MKHLLFVLAIVVALASCKKSGVASKEKLENNLDSFSYALGLLVISDFKDRMDVTEIDPAAWNKAMNDVYQGNTPMIAKEEAQMYLQNYMMAKSMEQANKYLEEGRSFLAENAKKPNIKVTGSGLQYEIINEGTGEIPDSNDLVTVHYHGTLTDGKVFDSSIERGQPAKFSPMGVIQGWTEALLMMKTGSKWKLYIPTELAYGENPNPNGIIKPNMALIFEIELLNVERQK